MESAVQSTRPLRILCLHGHGGNSARLCQNLSERLFRSIGVPASTEVPSAGTTSSAPSSAPASGLAVECRCVDAPFPARKRANRPPGKLWWRYDEDDQGDRPEDWAEMEVASTRLAKELEAWPCDGLLGFSQGAEMVHTAAVLAERGDPRFCSGTPMPRFLISLSGAVNPAHFEAPGGGGPPRDCFGPRVGPGRGEVRMPCLFVGDFATDGWYSARRFEETLSMYKDATTVRHGQGHKVPILEGSDAMATKSFLSRFFA